MTPLAQTHGRLLWNSFKKYDIKFPCLITTQRSHYGTNPIYMNGFPSENLIRHEMLNQERMHHDRVQQKRWMEGANLVRNLSGQHAKIYFYCFEIYNIFNSIAAWEIEMPLKKCTFNRVGLLVSSNHVTKMSWDGWNHSNNTSTLVKVRAWSRQELRRSLNPDLGCHMTSLDKNELINMQIFSFQLIGLQLFMSTSDVCKALLGCIITTGTVQWFIQRV